MQLLDLIVYYSRFFLLLKTSRYTMTRNLRAEGLQ